jgi:IS5 family transposase
VAGEAVEGEMASQPGFFDLDDRYAALSKAGDPLVRLKEIVPFETFRYRLEKALNRSDRARGGRPPYDCVLMFKVLVLQALYNLSDDQAEFQIGDRLSFMRFLDMGLSDKAPDAKTIWLFRELLTQTGAIAKLFAVFDARLKESGYLAMAGQIIDASLVAAPRQRNTEEEKRAIKAGEIPAGWQDTPAKLRQKDRDARWTVKFTKAKTKPDGSMPPVCGPIPHTGRSRTRHGSRTTACARAFIARNRGAGRCRAGRLWPTRRNPGCVPRSSTCLPGRRDRWGCSSAPSASPGPPPRSASPISPTTCSAWPGSTGELRPPDRNRAGRRQIFAPPVQNSAPDTAQLTPINAPTPASHPMSPPKRRKPTVLRGVQLVCVAVRHSCQRTRNRKYNWSIRHKNLLFL